MVPSSTASPILCLGSCSHSHHVCMWTSKHEIIVSFYIRLMGINGGEFLFPKCPITLLKSLPSPHLFTILSLLVYTPLSWLIHTTFYSDKSKLFCNIIFLPLILVSWTSQKGKTMVNRKNPRSFTPLHCQNGKTWALSIRLGKLHIRTISLSKDKSSS